MCEIRNGKANELKNFIQIWLQDFDYNDVEEIA